MTEPPAPPAGDDAPSLVPPGAPFRARGAVALGVGSLFAVAAMGADVALPGSFFVGVSGVLVAALGALDLAGMFDDGEPARRFPLARGVAAAFALGLTSVLFLVVLRAAAHARLPWQASAVAMPLAFLAVVASVFHAGVVVGPLALDERGEARPLHRRHGFWLVAIATVIALPMLGAHSLTDPWETHYGEVAREMVSRDDWISTWWAQEGWFFSKPVLGFWLQALFMRAADVGTGPDQMLAGGVIPRPEWAVRMPVFLLAVLASYALYKGVARTFGRRAGLLGGLALWSMPMWAMLSHQTMTDMPFVACMSVSMGAFLYGLATPEDERVRTHEIGPFKVSMAHVVLFGLAAVVLAQALYLLSRNATFVTERFAFFFHRDVFWSGSAGNCGLPGNEPCVVQRPASTFTPSSQGLVWILALAAVFHLNRGERRTARIAFLVAYVFAGLSTLAKGPLGILLPVACAGLYVVASGRFRALLRMELVSGLAIVLAVALPWYLAMHLRHGPQFVDRLIFHDMWKRALSHVHDTNDGEDVSIRYFVWQLGYAFFPWVGLVPTALLAWTRRPDDEGRGRGTAQVFLALWFVLGFALFAAIETKFHHYVFPVVPAAAMLLGLLLDRMLVGIEDVPAPRIALLASGALLASYGVFRLFPGHLDGFVEVVREAKTGVAAVTQLRPPSPTLAAACLAGGAVLVALGTSGTRIDRMDRDARLHGLACLAAALVVALVGRDLALRAVGENGADARLMHLFTYNYKRELPDNLDFTGVFSALTVVFVALSLLAVMARLRARVTLMMLSLSLAASAWSLSLYFVRTSPHWGQRETIAAYHLLRKGPEEPLVAFQMNWKGENFYTGNRIPAFVNSGEAFKRWVSEQRSLGVRTMFFTTEHGRVGNLQTELGRPAGVEVLTKRALNNKFALVRVRFDGP